MRSLCVNTETAGHTPGPPEPVAFDPTLHPELADVAAAARARAAGEEPRPLRRVLTWNRAISGGVLAFALLGVAATSDHRVRLACTSSRLRIAAVLPGSSR